MKINPLVYAALAIVILVGLFLLLSGLFKPKTSQTPNNLPVSETVSTQLPAVESKIKTFELIIQAKKLVSGPATIAVNQGDEVIIKITSDAEEEFHIHGYDNSAELQPNKEATITFTAKMSGRFPFELEQSKTELGAIAVQPK